MGSPSTLLNAGKTTNFIFRIDGIDLSTSDVKEINNIDSKSKVKDRISAIYEAGAALAFILTERVIFSNNLILIDSKLPELFSHVVLEFYTSKQSRLKDIIAQIAKENPLIFDVSNEHKFYEFKAKRFLTDVALGMMPSKVWTGQYDATGGYLIIKDDGDVLCYHIYNKNEFEEYLFNNTKLETASSSRHDFGYLYKENRGLFIKLNLQIRFIQ